jgi:hypothetical protein
VFGDKIEISPGLLAVQAAGIVALVAGVVLVARGPMLSQLRPGSSRPGRAGPGSLAQPDAELPSIPPPPPPGHAAAPALPAMPPRRPATSGPHSLPTR